MMCMIDMTMLCKTGKIYCYASLTPIHFAKVSPRKELCESFLMLEDALLLKQTLRKFISKVSQSLNAFTIAKKLSDSTNGLQNFAYTFRKMFFAMHITLAKQQFRVFRCQRCYNVLVSLLSKQLYK